MIKAGELDRKLVLLRATITRDALNEPVKTWGPLGPAGGIRCKRRPLSATEQERAQQIQATTKVTFLIRWATAWDDLSPLDEIDHEGRRYGIVDVTEMGRREGLIIIAAAKAEPEE